MMIAGTCYTALYGDVKQSVLGLPIRALHSFGGRSELHIESSVILRWGFDVVVSNAAVDATVFFCDIFQL